MKFTLEVHTQGQVFKRDLHFSEDLAMHWFDETNPDGELITDVRLWQGKRLVAEKGIINMTTKPTFERRHFNLIAEALRDTYPLPHCDEAEYARWREVVDTFAMRLRSTNPSFNRARFLEACGAGDPVGGR